MAKRYKELLGPLDVERAKPKTKPPEPYRLADGAGLYLWIPSSGDEGLAVTLSSRRQAPNRDARQVLEGARPGLGAWRSRQSPQPGRGR